MGLYWLIQALGHVLLNTHFWVFSLRKTESVLGNTLGKVRSTWRVKIEYITFKNWIMYCTVLYCTFVREVLTLQLPAEGWHLEVTLLHSSEVRWYQGICTYGDWYKCFWGWEISDSWPLLWVLIMVRCKCLWCNERLRTSFNVNRPTFSITSKSGTEV